MNLRIASTKKVQFLDVIVDFEGDLDLKQLKTLFLQQRYQEFPAPIRMVGENIIHYTMQRFMIKKTERKWDIVSMFALPKAARS